MNSRLRGQSDAQQTFAMGMLIALMASLGGLVLGGLGSEPAIAQRISIDGSTATMLGPDCPNELHDSWRGKARK